MVVLLSNLRTVDQVSLLEFCSAVLVYLVSKHYHFETTNM